MVSVDVNVSFNIAAAKAQIMAAADDALTFTGGQALKDINKHVPADQNFLRNSAEINSDRKAKDGEFALRWDEPYAQYLFHGEVMYGNPTNRAYGPKKLKFTEALAQMEWTKYAAEAYGADWQTVYQNALRKELNK